ncbi:GreA/GreB family elongation factor [Cesiribacter andamanensis]|uniref:Transcript cleavage factor greA n=1 Tax=Cesiribacter andamanensis AMV16 TaxID=1279009 RepID=M7MZ01_9BACT|nr:GreA/GreB family elongation factor [Cesiribacter andamanensis]EMR01678.1 Transcript cleavage factor greA [Cesiribacter andamanensis AMV16]
MSRAFVKEDDAGQPPIIPPRAALPPGTPNYVTPQGLELLRAEMAELEAERSQIEASREEEGDRTRRLTILNGRMSALSERLATAKLIDPRTQPPDEVRFGATVRLRTLSGLQPGLERSFTIVGIDEASVAEGRVAFVAPIARAVVGKRKGDKAQLRMARQVEEVEILDIQYGDPTNDQKA